MDSTELHNTQANMDGNQAQMSVPNPSSAIRHRFASGSIILTMLPVNSKWGCLTPVKFSPEPVPVELMARDLTLTREEYISAMNKLTNDWRFKLYNLGYKRIVAPCFVLVLLVYVGIYLSGIVGHDPLPMRVVWVVTFVAGMCVCSWIKIKLTNNLVKCLGEVNEIFRRHKIVLGVLDQNSIISCHKVHLCFIYLDTTDCVSKVQEVLEKLEEQIGGRAASEETTQQASDTNRITLKQSWGEEVLQLYLQKWCKNLLRHKLDWTIDQSGGNPLNPRHVASALCPCQFIQQILEFEFRPDRTRCCPLSKTSLPGR